ncbi:MAG TPA: hypothetical protein VFI91_05875 [Longimicrobiaceae bacterium]|nr:hypothetical protein [Longimicrobiaceae bacterium]
MNRATSWPSIFGLFLILIAAPPAVAQSDGPFSLAVTDASSDWRPTVRISGLLDQGLREALRSGLPLRVHLRVELWRKGLFDRLAGAREISLAIVEDPLDHSLTLHTPDGERSFDSLAEVEAIIGSRFVVDLGPDRSGRFYYLGTLQVETLSLSDLDELERWLNGEVQPAVEGSGSLADALERGLGRLFVRVIGLPTRQYEARTGTFEVR